MDVTLNSPVHDSRSRVHTFLKLFLTRLCFLLHEKPNVLIVMLSIGINLPGIFWGVDFQISSPFSNIYYGDEGLISYIHGRMVSYLGDTRFANWPSFYFYVSFAQCALPLLVLFPFVKVNVIYALSLRTSNVIFFAWTTNVLYYFGKEFPCSSIPGIHQKKIGIISALMYAIIPLSAYITPVSIVEPLLGFLCTYSCYYLQKAILGCDSRYFYRSCIFAGMAISTKYNALILVIPIGICLLVYYKRFNVRFFHLLIKGTFFLGLTLIIINIFNILNWESSLYYFLQNFGLVTSAGASDPSGVGILGLGPRYTGFEFLVVTLANNFGVIILIFIIGACLYYFLFIVRRAEKTFGTYHFSILLFVTLSIFVVFLSRSFSPRYFYQAFPMISILVGLFILRLDNLETFRKKIKLKKIWHVVFLSSLILASLYAFSVNLVKTRDTRVVAKRWIHDNLPQRAIFGIDEYIDIPDQVQFQRILPQLSPENLQHFTYDFLIISGAQYERWTEIDPVQYSNQSAFYLMLFNGSSPYVLIKTFQITSRSPLDFKSPSYLFFGLDLLISYIIDVDSMWGTDVYIFKHL